MTVRLIEVPACGETGLAAQLDSALSIARPLGAHIRVTYVRTNPVAEVAGLVPEAATGVWLAELADAAAARLKKRKHEFEEWCARNGLGDKAVEHALASTFATWEEIDGTIEETVMRRGRLSDLIVVKSPEADLAASLCFDAAVFASGRPTLVAPAKAPTNILGHVVLAWNGSLEATRAVWQCVDILHEAERVSIFSTPRHRDESQPSELADALRWHGIRCEHIHPIDDRDSVGAALLETADRAGGTAIVMGAFTHSRIREVLLGGVTRHVLRHSTLPMFMAH
ncbi:MAG TPA: universal stress protein [Aliidongia sp.]|nr:universal stress protein [Aliidongia sp.]